MNKYIIHPFLFSISFALFLFANNVEEISNLVAYDMIIPPILAFLLFSAAVFLILKTIIKDNHKAGVVSSIVVVSIFYYGVVYDLLKNRVILDILIGRHKFLLPLWVFLILLGIFWALKTKKNLSGLTKILNLFTILIVSVSVINISVYYISRHKLELATSNQVVSLSEDLSSQLPDIYYILPDMYARADVLKEYFGYDNKEFLDFLKDRGFAVANNSRSNYRITYFSVPSTLNMEYLDRFKVLAESKSDLGDYSELLQTVKDNEVIKFLKNNGYKIVRFRMDLPIDGADIDVGRPILSEYNYLLLDSTIFRAFGVRRTVFHTYFNWRMRTNIIKSFERLAEVPSLYANDPKFVFLHLTPPHWPYFFAADGSPVAFKFTDYDKVDPKQEREYYLGQVKFVNKKIEEAVDAILSKSKDPPIIIIQSDHGYNSPLDDGEVDPIISVKNISAYYLPGKHKKILPQNISAVNTFRFIFDNYFGTKLGLLENRSYEYNPDQPYEFKEINPAKLR